MAQPHWQHSFDDLNELHPKHRLHVLAIALMVPYAGGPLAEPAELPLLTNSIRPRLESLVRREFAPTDQELRTIYLVRQWLETLELLLDES